MRWSGNTFATDARRSKKKAGPGRVASPNLLGKMCWGELLDWKRPF